MASIKISALPAATTLTSADVVPIVQGGTTKKLPPSDVGGNLFTATNPSAITFPKIAADNSVSFRTPAQVLGDIGAQASGSYAASGANTDITSLTASVVSYDVKAYGAKGDARKVTDAVLNGTTTVTSATAAFTQADVGKVIWGIETASGASRLGKTTISSVTNATTVVVAVAATGSYSSINLVLGTDDTTAIQAAATAADAVNPKGRVLCPAGGYVFSNRLFNQSYGSGTDTYSVIGAGKALTYFYPTPDHAHSGSRIFNTSSNAARARFEGFTIDGSSFLMGVGNIACSDAPTNSYWHDVRITSFRAVSPLLNVGTSGSVFLNCEFINAQSGANGINVNGGADFIECYNGNHNAIGLSIAGGSVHWIGGTLDETSADTVFVYAGEFIADGGAVIFAGTGQVAVDVSGGGGTASAKICNSSVTPFGGNNNVTALKLASGTTARISQTKLTGSGTGFGLNNAGTAYDGGANLINSSTGTPLVTPEGWTVAKVATSDATTTGQSLVDITGLTFTAAASTYYAIEADLVCTTTADTAGTQYGINTTGGGTITVNADITGNVTSTTSGSTVIGQNGTADATAYLTTASQTGLIKIRGMLFSGTGTPVISIQHLKVTSGTSTVKIGSVMRIRLL